MGHAGLALYLLYIQLLAGDGARNLFTMVKWNEHFTARMLLFFVDKVAVNTPRYWERHNELLHDIGIGPQRRNELLCNVGNCSCSWPGPAQSSCVKTSVLHWLLYKENGETQFILWKSRNKSCLTLWGYESHSCIGNSFPNCQKLYEVAWNL